MYGFGTQYNGTVDEAVEAVTAALQGEGFGVLTDIDVQAALKEKIGVDRPAYRILGACNPALANQAIDKEPDIGLLLPCNVLVREDPEGVSVHFMDPVTVLGIVESAELDELGADVRERLQRVRDSLASQD